MIRRYLSGSVTNNVDLRAILTDGFVRFPNSVESRLCESVLRTAMEDFETESKTWQYKLSRIFDIVNTPKNRHSIKLKMSDDVKALLGETLYGDARRESFYETLYGANARLVELSLLLTFPGAPAQALHSDISYQALGSQESNCNLPGLASTFVAIQDVRREMGPTAILKGTHTKEYHATIKIDMESYSVDGTIETISNIDDENVEKKTFSMEELHDAAVLSGKGDVYTMDARCIHAGGANESESPRALVCFAFQREDEAKQDIVQAPGFTYHIHEDVFQRKYRLADFKLEH